MARSNGQDAVAEASSFGKRLAEAAPANPCGLVDELDVLH
jgi:hypothetical protein